MTPEQINRMIAEHCGWEVSWDNSMFKRPGGTWQGRGYDPIASCIPNYYSDLNAIHKAEKTLTPEMYDKHYWFHLCFVVAGRNENKFEQLWEYRKVAATATAPQRCEALLRTLNKWEEP